MSRYNYCLVLPLAQAETGRRSEFGEHRWWRWSRPMGGCLRWKRGQKTNIAPVHTVSAKMIQRVHLSYYQKRAV
jgi:hypothetical protein